MNEKKIKELYRWEAENSAPDMDALWNSIESRLEPKENIPPIEILPKKKFPIKTIAAIAACVCILAAAPAIVNTSKFESETAVQDNSLAAETTAYADAAANEEYYAEAEASEESFSEGSFIQNTDGILNYNELSFSSYSETVISCNGTPYGDSYFTEDSVLSQTDSIVIGTVKRVFPADDESCIYYELETSYSYPEPLEETVIVASCSPYTMKRGREYVIPLAYSEQGCRTVFDNIPQIEMTSDGGMVYYNGWSCLDNEYSQDIIYPQVTPDAFFYDRMKFTSCDISGLIEKFNEINEL